MSTVTTEKLLTAEEFFLLPSRDDGLKTELVRGRVVTMCLPGGDHGEAQGNIFSLIKQYIRGKAIGRVMVETGMRTELKPDSVRGPDVSYWSKERLQLGVRVPKYPDAAADLCVEVLSPGNTTREMNDKIKEYFFSGVRMVWIVDPDARTAVVYRQPGEGRILWEDATITGEDVIPGFECKVADFFE